VGAIRAALDEADPAILALLVYRPGLVASEAELL